MTKTLAQLDAEIAQAREILLRKRSRAAIRGLDAINDRDAIQGRIEKVVREINAAGGNRLGIQGDLRRDEWIEVWDVVTMSRAILGISIETGKIKFR
jgi:hypothetical protein